MTSELSSSRRRLGRGLGSLMSNPVQVEIPATIDPPQKAPRSEANQPKPVAADEGDSLRSLPLESIIANPKQPRQHFDEPALLQLAGSITASGLMQPIVVRKIGASRGKDPLFEIIAGERRWRAAKLAGLATIPALVRDVDDRTAAELSLVENLQREDLNPIERADAFKRLVDDFGLSQEDIAQQIGMDRSSISNHLRLLDLDATTKQLVSEGLLALGHAKALLGIANISRRTNLAAQAVREDWSVREIERRVKAAASESGVSTPVQAHTRSVPSPSAANVADLERRLSEHLGTKVRVKTGRSKGSGKLIIEFFTIDQFEGVLRKLQYQGE